MPRTEVDTFASGLASESRHGIGAQLCRVECGWRQTAECIGNLGGRDAAGLVERLPDKKVGQDRARGDCGDATLRFEASRYDSAVLEPDR